MEIHGTGPVRPGAQGPQQLEHTVQQGETLEGIANQHNVSAESLLSRELQRTPKMYLNLPPRVPETLQSGVILINHSSLQGKQEPLREKPTKKC